MEITGDGAQTISAIAQSAQGFVGYAGEVMKYNPKSYWRLGESAGPSALDVGSAGNNGTYNGSNSFNQAGSIPGDPNTAVRFGTTTADHLSCGNTVVYANTGQPFTLAANVKVHAWNGSGSHYPRVVKVVSSSGHAYKITFSRNFASYGYLSIGASSTWARLKYSGSDFNLGEWYQLVVTYNGSGASTNGNFKLYINGVEVSLAPFGAGFQFLPQRPQD